MLNFELCHQVTCLSPLSNWLTWFTSIMHWNMYCFCISKFSSITFLMIKLMYLRYLSLLSVQEKRWKALSWPQVYLIKFLHTFGKQVFCIRLFCSSFTMVCTTPGIPGKLLHFWIFFPGPWKTPWKFNLGINYCKFPWI